MAVVVFVVVAGLLATGGEGKAAKKVPVSAEEALGKLHELAERAKASADGTVSLSAHEYREYVHATPRLYSVVLMFTVASPGRGCKPCAIMWEPYTEAASGFARHHLDESVAGVEAAMVNGTAEDVSDAELPVFFGVIDYDKANGAAIFKAVQVSGTPYIAFVPPARALVKSSKAPSIGSSKAWRKRWTKDNEFNLRQMSSDTTVFLQFITRQCGLEIDVSRPLPLFRIVFAVAGTVGSLWAAQDKINAIVPFRLLFFGAFLCGVVYCYSGAMFCTIRSAPWTQAGKDGEMWFYPAQRHQLGKEAMVVGGLYATAVAGILVLLRGVPRLAAANYGTLVMIVPTVVGCFALWLALGYISVLFTAKMGGGYPLPLTNFAALLPRSWGYFNKYG
ncbi:uncharacterized protein AMSG_04123 [Thecamonas trahens ATCC 50062]|uniref:Uncharacterized protein n=1 Tax=Thecamonas trahens ATCC 50062 TaxID=461836 RepID=A0A0L0D676_THETB|nr:hypothetical protein AMSG_04123 [Thecamonas trahens ATCC 50062]KNC47892.1 hypothetical protein AMSG_04123 [Thecamonas trahens ATCC 50062]|eukprot:XP_013758914.1 hypothetical protein AMSG_04123 [Thecamonas trahens ATCC 50062]